MLDNDYAEGYQTTGIEGLRVTSAHEFHHLIQFSGYILDYSQSALYEATSTWMEYKVHPDLNDYRTYFDNLLETPQNYSFATHDRDNVSGYAHMHYLQTLVKQLDLDIVKEIWNEFKRSGKSFDAIDAALRARNAGMNLTNSYCTFARWSYFTGANALDTFFTKASRYTTIQPVDTHFIDHDLESVMIGSLSPLSFAVRRCVLPNERGSSPITVDFLITNGRSNLGKGGYPISSPEEYRLTVSSRPQEKYTPILNSNGTLYYHLDSPYQDFCAETFFNGSPGILVTANPTPQPFINDGADQMVFAVDLNDIAVNSVNLEIYSSAMTKVAGIHRDGLEILNNVQGIRWDGRSLSGELAPSGIYIYVLSINGSRPSVGKFAVVMK